MTITMYERVGFENRRPSPFSWRSRYAITHKGINVTYQPTRFLEADMIEQLSGQRYVPILVDGSKVVHDSWRIALYLEKQFPDRPSLFGGESALGQTRFICLWADSTLGQLIKHLIYADFIRCLAPEDRPYFRSSRETALGQSLEAACADRAAWQTRFSAACEPLETLLAEQNFIAGQAPQYVDYSVFSLFQWARLGSPQDLVREQSALAAWRKRMIGLFDGLADKFPHYPSTT